jgi:type II secretion system protein J
MDRKLDKSGFTLVELVTVMAVLPILLLLIHTALSSTTNARELVEENAARTQAVHAIRNVIMEDLSACYVPPRPRQSSEGQALTTNREFFVGRANGENGHPTLNFITRRPSRTAGDKPSVDINEVGYKIVASPTDYRYYALIRREQALFDDHPSEGGTETTIYDRVISAEILYFDGAKWLSDWDFVEKNDVPVAVKTTLEIEVGKPGQSEQETVVVTVPLVIARNTVAKSGAGQ